MQPNSRKKTITPLTAVTPIILLLIVGTSIYFGGAALNWWGSSPADPEVQLTWAEQQVYNSLNVSADSGTLHSPTFTNFSQTTFVGNDTAMIRITGRVLWYWNRSIGIYPTTFNVITIDPNFKDYGGKLILWYGFQETSGRYDLLYQTHFTIALTETPDAKYHSFKPSFVDLLVLKVGSYEGRFSGRLAIDVELDIEIPIDQYNSTSTTCNGCDGGPSGAGFEMPSVGVLLGILAAIIVVITSTALIVDKRQKK